MQGNLKTRPFGAVWAEFASSARTGVLTLDRMGARRQVCIIRGRVRLCASNVRGERLAEFLRREGGFDPAILSGLDNESLSDRQVAEGLLSSNACTPQELIGLARRHALYLLVCCAEWKDGAWEFHQGVPDIAGAPHFEIVAAELSLEKARRRPDMNLVTRLRTAQDARLRAATEARSPLPAGALTAAESAVIERVGTGTGAEVADVLAIAKDGADFSQDGLLAAAATLVQAGLLVRERAILAAREPASGATAGAAAEILHSGEFRPGDIERYKDLLTRMEGADYYQLLGVAATAPEKDIRRSYYAIAKQLHPDRFSGPEMEQIKPDMEVLFARITEAYNTLTDTFARREYDVGRGGVGAAAGTPVDEKAMNPQELARANWLRGKQLFEEGNYARALSFLKNAVDLDGSRPEHLFWLGRALSRSPSQRAEAVDLMMRAAGLDPTRAEFTLGLGHLYARMERREEAERAFRSVLRWSPKNTEAKDALEALMGTAKGSGLMGGLFGRKKGR